MTKQNAATITRKSHHGWNRIGKKRKTKAS